MNTAPGVNYVELTGCDRRFFRCSPLRATLSVESCAANWRRAQRIPAADLGFVGKCGDCAIGSAHAGERHVHRSRIFDLEICPRCRRGGARMPGNRRCISCYNREREVKAGKNAKGTKPGLVLDPRRLGAILNYGAPDQRLVDLLDPLTQDTIELAVQVLRTVRGRVAFCRPRGGRQSISTIDLATEMEPVSPLPPAQNGWPRKARRAAHSGNRLPNEFRGAPPHRTATSKVPSRT
jgi:hypothetical protein